MQAIYDYIGKVEVVGEVQTFPSGFTKRELVLTDYGLRVAKDEVPGFTIPWPGDAPAPPARAPRVPRAKPARPASGDAAPAKRKRRPPPPWVWKKYRSRGG